MSKHELQVLLGLLGHASTVVRPGRTFIRQLIELSKKPRLPSHKVRLNLDCRADLAWWSNFIDGWNGVALFPGLPTGPTVVSDASGSWGCGAFCEPSVNWFQLEWYPSWRSVNIAAKELVPIVISAAVWGASWRGKSIRFLSDNQAVVTCLTNRSAQDPCMVHLLRCLFFFEAHFEFELRASHIAGKANRAANALSRDRLTEFLSLHPQAPPVPAQVPTCLVELLMDMSLIWTSASWSLLFKNILQVVSPNTP